MKTESSRPFEFSREDFVKIGRGAGVAVVGAFSTWTMTLLVPAIERTADGGSAEWRRLWLLLAAAVVSSLVNAGRKFVADNSRDQT